MKNKVFYYLMAFLMVFGAKTTTIALIVDNKYTNLKGTTKPVEIIIPKSYHNELDRDRIGRRIQKKKTFTRANVVDSYNSSNGKVKTLGRTL